MKLRVGLIGLGDQWQSRHCPALLALKDRFDVRAICCEIAHKSSTVAEMFDAVPIEGFRAMIERDDIDAILALATDWVGPLPILAACESGKAVYSSAALDIAPEQVELVKRRVESAGIAFMAELPRRHSPATLRLKELIATRLGPPQLLFSHERMATEEQTNRLRRGNYCPITMRNVMELVDWCSYLVDEDPVSVVSALQRPVSDGGKGFYQMVNLTFPDREGMPGATAQLSVGHYVPSKWKDALGFRRPASLQISCEKGIAFIDLPSTLVWFDEAGQHTESLELERPVGEQMLTQFHRSVTSLVRQSGDLADAYRAMLITTSAIQSAVEGRRIEFDW